MLKKVKPVGVTASVVNQITNLIKSGHWKPGEKLPNEMELMESLNVGRSTIREAKRILSSMNLIESYSGKGSFVKEITFLSLINDEMLEFLLDDEVDMLLESRIVVETQLALLAVKRATDEDIEKMQACVNELTEAIQIDGDVFEAGRAFHVALSDAAHNTVLKKLNDILTEMLIKVQKLDYKKRYDKSKEITVHQNIINAIKQRDRWNVIKAMEEHFYYVSDIDISMY